MLSGELPVVVQVLGWCLLHFVWQAIAVGAAYALVRPVLARGNPRYLAAMSALLLLAACPAITAWYLLHGLAQPTELGDMVVTAAGAGAASGAVPAGGPQAAWLSALRLALPWLVLAWACGVLFIGVRVGRQWQALRAIVREAEALPAWQARARLLGERLGLRRTVRILTSVRIATPTLVGWIKPVVVMPLAVLARMPAEQLDLVLAHELAHVRRLDHVANLFQVVLETLLFYHPVVHWISRDARNERELCCDAMALRATGGRRRDFVAALAGLEEFRGDHAGLVLAASGGVLVERAWFIAGQQAPRHRPARIVAPLLAALLVTGVGLGAAWQHDDVRQRVQNVLVANAALLQQQIAASVRAQPVAPVPPAGLTARPRLRPIGMVAAPPRADVATLAVDIRPAAVGLVAVSDLASRMAIAPVQAQQPQAAAGISRSVLPQVLHTVAPSYPPEAQRAGIEGRVEVEFTLESAGIPRDLRITAPQDAGVLGTAALQALAQWRFAPPGQAGHYYRQTFTFRLDGAENVYGTMASGSCLPATGTHICRRASAPDPAIQVRHGAI